MCLIQAGCSPQVVGQVLFVATENRFDFDAIKFNAMGVLTKKKKNHVIVSR